MSFLTPWFLLGLLAAAIPVAIHLIRRENPPKILFGSLRFLKQTSKKLILFQQIQQWLLLLLRAALICLLVLAFARPLFHQASMARLIDAEPQSVVLLLDMSLSMQYGDRFARAKDEALRALSGLSAGDEAAVITFAGSTVAVRELTTDLSSLRAFINNLDSPGYDRVRFYPALRLANDLLSDSRYENRSIVMVSDFQANGMSETDAGWMLLPGLAFRGVDVGDDRSSNLTLTDVRSPQQLVESESDYQVLARVRSTGSVQLDQGSLALLINGQQISEQSVDLRNRSEAVINLPMALDDSGAYAGELILSGDSFDIDNRWYFMLDVLPRMRVLVVNGDPSADWFDDEAHWFVLALEGMEDSPFSVTTIGIEALDTTMLAAHDAVALLNVSALGNSQLRDLESFAGQGGAVLLAPGNRVNAGQFNQQLGELSPALLSDMQLLQGNDYRLIADVDRRHPALRALDVDWSARFQGFWRAEAVDDAVVLMQFDSGDPLLVEGRYGQGRTMLVASSLDLAWSNFPLQGLYLPFVHEVLTYLVQPPVRERAYQVGDVVDVSSVFDNNSTSLELREPSGSVVTIDADSPFYTTREPGFVEVGTQTVLAVNIQSDAASLNRIDISLLYDRIINPETTPDVAPRIRTAQLLAEIEQPQRLWWWILLVVLLLLLLEAWIANRTYR